MIHAKARRSKDAHGIPVVNVRRSGDDRPVNDPSVRLRRPSCGRERGLKNSHASLSFAALLVFGLFLSGCHRDKTPYTLSAQEHKSMAVALKEDTVQTVVTLIDKGMSPNATNEAGKPYLLLAASAGDTDIVGTFISYLANVNVTDSDGQTPLMAAAIASHSDIITLLLDRKADPNLALTRGESQGMTALHFAAERGNADILLKLLQHGALPDTADAKGRTVLMLAAASGHEQAVEALLLSRPDPKQNAEVNAKDAAGKTALNYAESKRSAAIIARLKQAGVKERP